MIHYIPHSDIDDIKTIYPEVSFDKNRVYGAYTTPYESVGIAKSLVKIDGRFCEITGIVTDITDKLLTEGLLRASLNFAGNRGAYIAKCADESIADVLTLLGFTKSGEFYEGDIPTLLQGSCCKAGEK